MSVVHRSLVCDRVRAQVSLGLDGELSQLETRMIAAHLSRCADCATFEEDVRTFTSELRAAPMEQLEHPIEIVRSPRRALPRVQIGVAAVFAVALLAALTQLATPDNQAFATPERYATYEQLSREVAQIIADGKAFSRHQGDAFPL
jgi:predicted anti-sigma-YlaC factor YlaD